MRIIKTLGLIVVTFTAAEFFTMFRLQEKPLGEFTKQYFDETRQAWDSVGSEMDKNFDATGSFDTMTVFKEAMFPNR